MIKPKKTREEALWSFKMRREWWWVLLFAMVGQTIVRDYFPESVLARNLYY